MNKLNRQKVYLAGAVDRVPDRGVAWRDNITPFLESLNIEVFNPLKKPLEIGAETENAHFQKIKYKSEERYDEISNMMKIIRTTDLRLVDICNFLVVNLDLDVHPCGTYEEIFWANRQKKPILIHMEQGKKNAPDWLFGTIPHQMIFSNWNEIKEYLKKIDSGEELKTYSRWYFFN